MPRVWTGALGLGAVLLLTGCGAKTHYNPFRVPPEQLRSQVKVLALMPMDAPQNLEDPSTATRTMLHIIEAALRSAGLSVVPADEVKVIWDSVAAQRTGFYDPRTGARDQEKLKAFRMDVYRELKARFAIDALLFSRLAVVEAKLERDKARWDGTSEGASRKGFWKAVLGVSHSGTIPALSLQLFLLDTDEGELYVNSGGIQVLGKVDPAGNFNAVSREQLFSRADRNVRAVNLALNPFLGRATKE